MVWVVDSGDRMRMQDCRHELHILLQEDVRIQPVDLAVYSMDSLET